jgi:predicted O-methyltransferase YrrM
MNWIDEKAYDYAALHTSPLPALQQEVLNFTMLHHPHAHMISGHLQGVLLQMISQMVRPDRILEIGTFTGFSALCLAEGLTPHGELHTLELRPEDAATARAFFDKTERAAQMHVHVGDAKKLLGTMQGPWDLVFLDADKTSYIQYYEAVLPAMKTGSFLMADNVLFHGEVLQTEFTGKNALAIAAFNKHVSADERVEQVMLTLRDGLMLIRKK